MVTPSSGGLDRQPQTTRHTVLIAVIPLRYYVLGKLKKVRTVLGYAFQNKGEVLTNSSMLSFHYLFSLVSMEASCSLQKKRELISQRIET